MWLILDIRGTFYEAFYGREFFAKYCIGNPLYHWTHLELRRYFKINKLLSGETAEEIWSICNAKLQQEDFTTKVLIKRSNVKVICTTDDPVDSLEYHKQIAEQKDFDAKVLPTFRPDKAINIEKDTFKEWFKKLQEVFYRILDMNTLEGFYVI